MKHRHQQCRQQLVNVFTIFAEKFAPKNYNRQVSFKKMLVHFLHFFPVLYLIKHRNVLTICVIKKKRRQLVTLFPVSNDTFHWMKILMDFSLIVALFPLFKIKYE